MFNETTNESGQVVFGRTAPAEPAAPIETAPAADTGAQAEPATPVTEAAQPATPATPATAETPAPQAAVKAPEEPVASVKPAEATALPAIKEDDEYGQKLIKAYAAGELDKFLQAHSTDYDKLSAEELFRAEIKQNQPSLSDKAVERLLNKKLETEFGFGEYMDEEDRAIAEELRDAAANKIREGFKQQQQQYQPPTPAQSQSPEEYLAAQNELFEQKMLAEKQAFEERFKSDPEYKQFETNRLVRIGSGEAAFNLEVPDTLDVVKETLAPPQEFFSRFYNEDGTMNTQKWLKALAFINDMDGYDTNLIKHARGLGEAQHFDELENARPAGSVSHPAPPANKPRFIG